MRAYKLTRRKERVEVMITSLPDPLPKVKIPLWLFTKIHKPEFYVEFIFEEEVTDHSPKDGP